MVCVDEMGPLATIPRGGRSWGKRSARRRDRYHKGPTIQLLAAFAPHTGQAIGFPSPTKTGEVMLTFLRDVVLPRFGAGRKLYLIWDNFSAHKRARNLGRPSAQHSVLLDTNERFLAEQSAGDSLTCFENFTLTLCSIPTGIISAMPLSTIGDGGSTTLWR